MRNDSLGRYLIFGQWLWHSWQRGRFRYKKTRVRIQSSATFVENIYCKLFVDKTKMNGPFIKKYKIWHSWADIFLGILVLVLLLFLPTPNLTLLASILTIDIQ